MKAPVFLVSASWLLGLTFSFGQGLHGIPGPQGVWILEGKDSVLFYRSATLSREGLYPRAHYIHPLFGPDGQPLTEDFPPDHPHHRGIFWAWHQVYVGQERMGDAWECRDFNWDVKRVRQKKTDSSLTLSSRVLWKSPELTRPSGAQRAFVEENTDIRVFPEKHDVRIIEFDIRLRALRRNVRIGGSEDAKGYGGFSVRMKLPPHPVFGSESGTIQPEENAVYAGNWVQISPLPGHSAKESGSLVIIAESAADSSHLPWILRSSGSMQNAVFPGREPISLHPERPVRLRYRLLISREKLSPKAIGRYAQFSETL